MWNESFECRKSLDKVLHRGISQEVISTLCLAGMNVMKWLNGFNSVEESINESVEAIKNHPLIPKDIHVHGSWIPRLAK